MVQRSGETGYRRFSWSDTGGRVSGAEGGVRLSIPELQNYHSHGDKWFCAVISTPALSQIIHLRHSLLNGKRNTKAFWQMLLQSESKPKGPGSSYGIGHECHCFPERKEESRGSTRRTNWGCCSSLLDRRWCWCSCSALLTRCLVVLLQEVIVALRSRL